MKAIKCSLNELIEKINKNSAAYLKHVYDTGHQHKSIDIIKNNEAFVVIDFSENYVSKYASEIQSAHIGASKKQVSLHTGAFFIGIKKQILLNVFLFVRRQIA